MERERERERGRWREKEISLKCAVHSILPTFKLINMTFLT